MEKSDRILWNVTVVDGCGTPPQEGMAVAVAEGRIQWVSPVARAVVPKGATVLELDGMTVMPGLIDAHVHLSGVASDRISAFSIHPTVRVYRTVYQAQELLSFGITGIRDISPHGTFLKRLVALGEIAGPRIVACGAGLVRRGGHADIPELPFEIVDSAGGWGSNNYWGVFADGLDEIRTKIRLMLRDGIDQIKFWASGGGYSTVDPESDTLYSAEEISAIMDEARLASGMPVLAHAESRKAVALCVDAGVHSIEHGEGLDEELAERMAEKGISLVPTLNLTANWYRDRFGDAPVEPAPISAVYGPFRTVATLEGSPQEGTPQDCERLRKEILDTFCMAREKGVRIALGSDTVRDRTTPYGLYTILEAEAMHAAGMPALEVIEAGTRMAADVCGTGRFVGTVEAGKIADLLVLHKNPADDLSCLKNRANIKYVIQNGRVVVEDGALKAFGLNSV
ncbi:MAG: amidohydrolase family protein [Clostridiales Family XIII bacterium]|jgi:imidazolonepropionase-like amidohydrolase|nr:amidohydrolase family protein [Clostridiales Family XIII bacterium]